MTDRESEIRQMLADGLCSLIFIKLNGDRRNAVATTNKTFIPRDQWPKPPKERLCTPWVKDGYVRYYDLTCQGWRCMVVDEIIAIKPLNPNPND